MFLKYSLVNYLGREKKKPEDYYYSIGTTNTKYM